ncbi:MAG: hypothetical protein C0599_17860 [Salinivirgaceae bacterium]|nr:MAG: hypothetical protein C0599_17860 [Salinivirgaceae bacterium]
MKKVLYVLLMLMLFFSATSLKGQNEKFKALFLYNFTKYIEWPASKQGGDFVIGVLGNSPIKKELDIIASKKRIDNQPIKVKVFKSISDIGSCHVLFIPPGKSASLPEVNKKVEGKGILVITDKPGLGKKGAGINYVLKGGHQDFEINKGAIKDQSLKVNSSLFALGTVID